MLIKAKNTFLSQSMSCCWLRLTNFPVERKSAPSITPVVVNAQQAPQRPWEDNKEIAPKTFRI